MVLCISLNFLVIGKTSLCYKLKIYKFLNLLHCGIWYSLDILIKVFPVCVLSSAIIFSSPLSSLWFVYFSPNLHNRCVSCILLILHNHLCPVFLVCLITDHLLPLSVSDSVILNLAACHNILKTFL